MKKITSLKKFEINGKVYFEDALISEGGYGYVFKVHD
jgi:hypothetical protein